MTTQKKLLLVGVTIICVQILKFRVQLRHAVVCTMTCMKIVSATTTLLIGLANIWVKESLIFLTLKGVMSWVASHVISPVGSERPITEIKIALKTGKEATQHMRIISGLGRYVAFHFLAFDRFQMHVMIR